MVSDHLTVFELKELGEILHRKGLSKREIELGDRCREAAALCDRGIGPHNIAYLHERIAEVKHRQQALEEELVKVRAQLPEGMKHCTIIFKQCYKGHGRLTASNWVDNGCPHCTEIERLAEEMYRDIYQENGATMNVNVTSVIVKHLTLFLERKKS